VRVDLEGDMVRLMNTRAGALKPTCVDDLTVLI